MATRSSPVNTLSNILAAPVLAAIDADAQASQRFLDFIESVGFTRPNGKGERELTYFSFTFSYLSNGKQTPLIVSLPVLSLIPLPLLSMAKVTFNYALQIVDLRVDSDSGRPIVRAMYADQASGLVPPGTMSVAVSVETSDIPAGIARLLNLSSDAVRTD